jgi:hypothetical protein
MSELTDKLEEAVGGILGGHELKPVAEPALVDAIKAGEALLSKAHLDEIKLRRAVADLDTLIAAYETAAGLLEKYVPAEFLPDNLGWGQTDSEPAASDEDAEASDGSEEA